MTTFFIDCYDPRAREDVLSVRRGADEFRFVFARAAKSGVAFHAGLFVDEAALNSHACYRCPRSRRACMLKESPIKRSDRAAALLEKRYDHVFTFEKELLQRRSTFKLLYYGTSWLGDDWRARVPNVQKTKIISFVGSIQHPDSHHGYVLRREVAQRLQQHGRADCFGKGIREIPSKLFALEPYCFSVAMENVRKDYYFTEKLVDCLLTETVPIYWGCPGIGEIFDLRGMIQFKTLDELLAILDTLSLERYQAMLPFARENKRIAVANQWHTDEGLFSRIADEFGKWVKNDVSQPSWSRGKIISALRWLVETSRLKRHNHREGDPHMTTLKS